VTNVEERLRGDEHVDAAAAERTLRAAAADADAARFVARDAELAMARDLLDSATPSRVLFVSGPGGIGKSTLLRAIGRLAADAGFTVVHLGTSPDAGHGPALDRLIDDLVGPALVVVDEAERLGSELTSIRDGLLDRLSDSSRMVFAGRIAPDPTWRADGLDAIVRATRLGPLGPDDAVRLLDRHRVSPDAVAGIVEWAQGSPLALTVAALAPGSPTGMPVASELEARLTTWVTGQPILDGSSDVLEVAALAPMVDARLLAAVLPARPTRGAMARLLALPVVERVGDRAVLHDVLAAAIRSRLEWTAPERRRDLTRRIVEHLGMRARLGDIGALVELSQFVEEPAMRQAISNRPSPTLFAEPVGAVELAEIGRAQSFGDGPDWAAGHALIAHDATHRLVVRRADRSVVLSGAFGRADAVTNLGPVTESLRAAVADQGADPSRTFVGVVWFADAPAQERADAARLGAGGLMHLHGIADMQAVLIHYPPPDRRPIEALAAIARPMGDDRTREVVISDFRPHGVAGFVESIVLAELGAAPRSTDHERLLAVDDDPVRQAALAARLDDVFDDSPGDRRLRQVVELAHLGPRPSEQECLDRLHVSRRTWFRLLRTARERVVDPTR
jgi:hypothetical protein